MSKQILRGEVAYCAKCLASDCLQSAPYTTAYFANGHTCKPCQRHIMRMRRKAQRRAREHYRKEIVEGIRERERLAAARRRAEFAAGKVYDTGLPK